MSDSGQQQRGAKRTAILLSLLALGVYAVFFLKHLV